MGMITLHIDTIPMAYQKREADMNCAPVAFLRL